MLNPDDLTSIFAKANEIDEEYIRLSANNFMLFAGGLFIPSATGPQLFNECMADFQRSTFIALGPTLYAVKRGVKPLMRRFWIERTKKSSKDGDLAVCMLWAICFATRPILIQICASDQDQAAIVKRRIESIIYYNPWLNKLAKVQQNKVKSLNGLAELKIESTDDAGGSHGETPDILVLNELVHVKKWAVMETHMNNADGVPRGVVIISTNAGIKGTKAEVWRKEALENKRRWSTHIYSKVAPWINEEDVKAARKRDPVGAEHARLWGGRWVSGKGGAVDEDSIDRCFKLKGPTLQPERGWMYVAGLDLGISHDHCGIAVLGVNREKGRIKVCYVKGIEPSVPNNKGINEVDIDIVEAECERIQKTYCIQYFGYDPAAGGAFSAQRLRKKNLPMREMTFASTTNCTEMAVAYVTSVKDGKLECYEDEEGRLRRDFGKFSIIVKVPNGYKLEAVSDEYGHADVGTALIICLPRAVELLGGWGGLDREADLQDGTEEELTEEEVKELPDDLRDIYDMDAQYQKEYVKKPTISSTSLDPFADY